MFQSQRSVPKGLPREEAVRAGKINVDELRKAVAEIDDVELTETWHVHGMSATFYVLFTPGEGDDVLGMSVCRMDPTVESDEGYDEHTEWLTRQFPRVETALLGRKNKYGYESVKNKYGYNEYRECRNGAFHTIEAVVGEIERVRLEIRNARDVRNIVLHAVKRSMASSMSPETPSTSSEPVRAKPSGMPAGWSSG